MYKIFATAEDAGKHSFKTSGFLNGHDCVVKVDAGYILVPVSTYSGWTDYNAVVAEQAGAIRRNAAEPVTSPGAERE